MGSQTRRIRALAERLQKHPDGDYQELSGIVLQIEPGFSYGDDFADYFYDYAQGGSKEDFIKALERMRDNLDSRIATLKVDLPGD